MWREWSKYGVKSIDVILFVKEKWNGLTAETAVKPQLIG